ncbi:MAG: DNA replication/repair protein RecF [Thiohalomonadales bacterium]
MKIDAIQITNFRNIREAILEFHPQVNWIVGKNGSGKTSLLEALYCLGSSRSFRTNNYNQLVNFDSNGLNIYAQIRNDTHKKINIGIQILDKLRRIRVDHEEIRTASSLAEHLAIQVITPNQSRLIEDGPRYRRKFMDWGLFHVEHRFKSDWSRMTKILKQRNANLKVAQHYEDIKHWDLEYLEVSESIREARTKYTVELFSHVENYISELRGFLPVSFELYNGWPNGKTLAECIQEHYVLDKKRGVTQYGPHKSDLRIKTQNHLFREIASRGQIKLLATILKLSQLDHLSAQVERGAILMIDDLASEFDPMNQRRIFDWALSTKTQIFLTCTDVETKKMLDPHSKYKMFHVEHGAFKEVL